MKTMKDMFSLVDVRQCPWETDKEQGYYGSTNVVKNYWWFTVNGKALLYNYSSYQMNSDKRILTNKMNAYLYDLFPDLQIEQIPIAYIKRRN